MTAENFAYWLQGFFEIAKPTEIDARQTRVIGRHLALVFNHVVPEDEEDAPGQSHDREG